MADAAAQDNLSGPWAAADAAVKTALFAALVFFVATTLVQFDLLLLAALLAVNVLVSARSWEAGCALVIAEISLFAQVPAERYHYFSVAPELAALTLAALWIANPRPLLPRLIGKDPAQWAMLAFTAAAAVSAARGTSVFLSDYASPWISLARAPAGIFLLTPWAQLAPLRPALTIAEAYLVFCIVRTSVTRKGLEIIVTAAAAASAAVLLAAAREFWLVDTSPLYHGVSRLRGTFQDPNCLASYLIAVIPLVAWCASLARHRARLLWGILLSFALFTLACTGSRGAWAGLFAAVIYSAFTPSLPETWRRWTLKTLAAFLCLLIAGVIAVTAVPPGRRAEILPSGVLRAWQTFDPRESIEIRSGGRAYLWRDAGETFLRRPVTGIGIGQFFRTSPLRPDPVLRGSNPYREAHSFPLGVAAELGLAGLIPYVIALAVIFVSPLPRWPAAGSRLGPALKAAALAVFVHSLFDQNLLYPEHMMLFCALAAGVRIISAHDEVRAATPAPRNPLFIFAPAAACAALYFFAADRRPLQEREAGREEETSRISARAAAVWKRRGELPVSSRADWLRAEEEEIFNLTPRPEAELR